MLYRRWSFLLLIGDSPEGSDQNIPLGIEQGLRQATGRGPSAHVGLAAEKKDLDRRGRYRLRRDKRQQEQQAATIKAPETAMGGNGWGVVGCGHFD